MGLFHYSNLLANWPFYVFVLTNILCVCQNNMCFSGQTFLVSRQTFYVSGQTFFVFFKSCKFFLKILFCHIHLKAVLQPGPCHKDYIHTLGSKISAWEGGQKIGHTDRRTSQIIYSNKLKKY